MSITKICRISGTEFTISDSEIALLDKLSPIIGGEKFLIPPPTLCPEERLRRRAQYRNYFALHKRKCDLTGKDIISTFPKDSKSIVWNQQDWWSDRMDGFAYAEAIDWEKDFSLQYAQFMRKVPHVTLDNAYKELENSEFVSGNGNSKDCYLTSNGNNNEKCLYGFFVQHDRYVMNSIYTRFSENCSFTAYVWKCYNLHFSYNCEQCRDAWYAFSCDGCEHLIGCIGLKNQKYQILNRSCFETEFEHTLKKIQADPRFRVEFEQKFHALREEIGIEENITTGSVDTTGDYCYDSKNTHASYNSAETEDSWYIHDASEVRDSMDITSFGDYLSLSYDSIGVGGNSSHLYWCQGSWSHSNYQFYCHNCHNCSYLFGCSGLHHVSYCIFNQQYTKEDWEMNVKKLIRNMQKSGEWGEFWDAKSAWYPYDASHAMMILPLSKEEVLERGLEWSGYELKAEGVTKMIPALKLPFDIQEIPDDILNWALLSRKTGKPYKIQTLELEMHRKFGIPLPHLHPFERIEKLFEWSKRNFSFDF